MSHEVSGHGNTLCITGLSWGGIHQSLVNSIQNGTMMWNLDVFYIVSFTKLLKKDPVKQLLVKYIYK